LEGQSTMHLFSFWLEPRQQNILNMKRHGTPTYANFNETWLFSKWTTISGSQSQLCKTTISHSQSQLLACNSVVLSQNSTHWHPFTVLEAGCWIFVLPLGPGSGQHSGIVRWGCRISLSGNLTRCCAMLAGYPFHFSWCDDRFPWLNPKNMWSHVESTVPHFWTTSYKIKMLVIYQIMSHSVPLIYRLYLHYGLYPITFNYALVPFFLHLTCLHSIYLQVHVHTHIIQSTSISYAFIIHNFFILYIIPPLFINLRWWYHCAMAAMVPAPARWR